MVKNGKGKGPKEQVLVEEDNRLALIEDQKRQHLYVVPIEHIVCDPPTVKERDEVQFSYGKKFFQGSILKIDSDAEVLNKELKKVKKASSTPKQRSFHEDQPRLAVLKHQEQQMSDIMTANISHGVRFELKRKKADKKKEKEAKKARAELTSDREMLQKEDDDKAYDSLAYQKFGCSSKNSQRSEKSESDADSQLSSDNNDEEEEEEERSEITEDPANKLVSDSEDSGDSSIVATPQRSKQVHIGQTADLKQLQVIRELRMIKMSPREPLSSLKTVQVSNVKQTTKSNTLPVNHPNYSEGSNHIIEDKPPEISSLDADDEPILGKDGSFEPQKKPEFTDGEDSDSDTGKKAVYQAAKQRNMNIYDGVTYKVLNTDSHAQKVHDDYEVYADRDDIEEAEESNSATKYIRAMMTAVYTRQSMKQATPSGFPARGKGTKHIKEEESRPRLHPHGIKAILKQTKHLQKTVKKGWRPPIDEKTMKHTISGLCSSYKRSKK